MPFCGLESQQLVMNAFAVLDRIVQVKAVSHLYETPSWPDHHKPPFVNAVVQVATTMSPHALLAGLHAIEAGFGRRRSVKNAPRTLDLDLISYGDFQCNEGAEGLTLPHPRFSEREFVLAPLCDIAPDWRPVGAENSIGAILAALEVREARRIS